MSGERYQLDRTCSGIRAAIQCQDSRHVRAAAGSGGGIRSQSMVGNRLQHDGIGRGAAGIAEVGDDIYLRNGWAGMQVGGREFGDIRAGAKRYLVETWAAIYRITAGAGADYIIAGAADDAVIAGGCGDGEDTGGIAAGIDITGYQCDGCIMCSVQSKQLAVGKRVSINGIGPGAGSNGDGGNRSGGYVERAGNCGGG